MVPEPAEPGVCAAPRDLSQSCMSPTHGHEPLAALMASCPQPPPGERRGPSRQEGSEEAAWSSTRLLPGAGRDVTARPVTEARLWVLQEQEETSALLSCAPTYMGTTGVGGHARGGQLTARGAQRGGLQGLGVCWERSGVFGCCKSPMLSPQRLLIKRESCRLPSMQPVPGTDPKKATEGRI